MKSRLNLITDDDAVEVESKLDHAMAILDSVAEILRKYEHDKDVQWVLTRVDSHSNDISDTLDDFVSLVEGD